jgi:hypothetical protein
MKLFNMVSEVGRHEINQVYSKDMFGNMQVGPVTVGYKNEKDGIYAYKRN